MTHDNHDNNDDDEENVEEHIEHMQHMQHMGIALMVLLQQLTPSEEQWNAITRIITDYMQDRLEPNQTFRIRRVNICPSDGDDEDDEEEDRDENHEEHDREHREHFLVGDFILKYTESHTWERIILWYANFEECPLEPTHNFEQEMEGMHESDDDEGENDGEGENDNDNDDDENDEGIVGGEAS